jgi:hypothetical protein
VKVHGLTEYLGPAAGCSVMFPCGCGLMQLLSLENAIILILNNLEQYLGTQNAEKTVEILVTSGFPLRLAGLEARAN